MTTSAASIDDLLIGVFLTASLLFIIIWSIMLLKWKKKYLYKIFPCVPNRTNAARIKKQEKQNSIPNITTIINESHPRNHDTSTSKSSMTATTTAATTIRSVPQTLQPPPGNEFNPFATHNSSFVDDSLAHKDPVQSSQEESNKSNPFEDGQNPFEYLDDREYSESNFESNRSADVRQKDEVRF